VSAVDLPDWHPSDLDDAEVSVEWTFFVSAQEMPRLVLSENRVGGPGVWSAGRG
jgi:hypothetical protein